MADVGGETGAESDFEEISPPEEASKWTKGKERKGEMVSKPAKDRRGGPNIPERNAAKEPTSRDSPRGETEHSSLGDDAGSPLWIPDPNSPSFGKGGSESFIPLLGNRLNSDILVLVHVIF